jgi:hypothetical protein
LRGRFSRIEDVDFPAVVLFSLSVVEEFHHSPELLQSNKTIGEIVNVGVSPRISGRGLPPLGVNDDPPSKAVRV